MNWFKSFVYFRMSMKCWVSYRITPVPKPQVPICRYLCKNIPAANVYVAGTFSKILPLTRYILSVLLIISIHAGIKTKHQSLCFTVTGQAVRCGPLFARPQIRSSRLQDKRLTDYFTILWFINIGVQFKLQYNFVKPTSQ